MSIVFEPRRSISGVCAGAWSVRYKPIDAWTVSGRPLGFRCICTTRSVPGSIGHGYASRTGALPGRPTEKMSVRKTRAWHVHPAEARRGIFRVEPADLAGVVEQHARVMQHARIARAELERTHVAPLGQRYRQDEVAKDVGTVGGHLERSAAW